MIRNIDTTSNKHPKISIIIVTLNVCNLIQPCLNSIYKQRYPNIEIIVMDGGSTDGTVEILRTNKNELSYLNSENDNGIYHAMNKALEHITGDWVYFLGADDVLFDDFSTLAHKVNNPVFIYYANVFLNGKKFRGEISSYQHSKSAICHQAIIYPKQVFDNYRYNTRYRISADHELNMRCWKDKNFTFKYVDLVIANFNHTGISSKNLDLDLEKDKAKLIFKYHGFINWIRYSFRQLKGILFLKD